MVVMFYWMDEAAHRPDYFIILNGAVPMLLKGVCFF